VGNNPKCSFMVHLVSTDLNLVQPIMFSFQEVEFDLRGFPKFRPIESFWYIGRGI